MKSAIRLLALAAAFFSGSVIAAHRTDNYGEIRVHIPLHVHGAERLSLGRLIKSQRRLDLDNYVLRAVVVHGSHGHTRLTIGRYSSPTVHLNHNKVRIEAPARHGNHWRLYTSRDAQVTAITAILEPRLRVAYRGFAQPGFNLGWMWNNGGDHEYRDHGRKDRKSSHRPIKHNAQHKPAIARHDERRDDDSRAHGRDERKESHNYSSRSDRSFALASSQRLRAN